MCNEATLATPLWLNVSNVNKVRTSSHYAITWLILIYVAIDIGDFVQESATGLYRMVSRYKKRRPFAWAALYDKQQINN